MYAQLKVWDKLEIKDIIKKLGGTVYDTKTGYPKLTLDAQTVTSMIKSLQELHKDIQHYHIICKVMNKINEN